MWCCAAVNLASDETKRGVSLAPCSVPASKEKPHRKYGLAHKQCTLKTYSFVQLDLYWLKEKLKIYRHVEGSWCSKC